MVEGVLAGYRDAMMQRDPQKRPPAST